MTSRLPTDTLNDTSQSFSMPVNETPSVTTVSPSTLRIKLKKTYVDNDNNDEFITYENKSCFY